MKLGEVNITFEPCDEISLEPADIKKISLGNLHVGLSGDGDHIEKTCSTDEAYLEIRLDDQSAEGRWLIRRLDAHDITWLTLQIDDEWQLIQVPWDVRSDYTNFKQQGYYNAKDKLYELLITENDERYRRFARLHSDDRKGIRFY